jgi:hypothetical protein
MKVTDDLKCSKCGKRLISLSAGFVDFDANFAVCIACFKKEKVNYE